MTEARNLPPAVVLGLSPTGLHVVRALGAVGVPVIGVAEGVQAGGASRYLEEVIPYRGEEELITALERRFPQDVGAEPRPVLIPTSDQMVEVIVAQAARLGRRFIFQDSYADGLAATIMSKDSFYRACEDLSVVYPRLWSCRKAELPSLGERIGYPCMIKPSRIHDVKEAMRGRKGWILRAPRDMPGVIEEIPEGAGVLLVQEIVPGPESAITLWCGYLDRDGRVQQSFTARKLRQYPPGFGSASLVQSHEEEETRQISESLLQRLGYRGIAAAEFKRDPDGRLKIIEVNVRPSLWFGATTAAGRHPVLAAYRDLTQSADLPDDRAQVNGIRWRYLLKDLWSAAFYRRNKDFVLPPPDIGVCGSAQRQVGAVFDGRDPRPVLTEATGLARKLLARRHHRKDTA